MAKRSDIHFSIFYFLLCMAVASLPFTIFLMLPIAILIFLNWLVEGNFKTKFSRLRQEPLRAVAFSLLLIFFLLHAFSLIYSHNVAETLSNLECKMWFLLMPLTLLTADSERFNNSKIENLLLLFTFSSACVALINLVWSGVQWSQNDFQNFYHYFYYVKVSHLLPSHPTHPSYLAMYMTLASFITLYFLFLSQRFLSAKQILKWGLLFLVVLFSIFIFLLQSKAGLLIYFPLLLVVSVYLLNRRKKRIFVTISAVVAVVTLSFVILSSSSGYGNRLKLAYEDFFNRKNENIGNQHGVGMRFAVWDNSLEVFKEHFWIGVGAGDVVDYLLDAYEDDDLDLVVQKAYNSHNQYLQTSVGLGILGLLSLLSILIWTLFWALRKRSFLLLLFLVVVALNLLVESMFETRAGADFFPLLYSILIFPFFQNRKIGNQISNSSPNSAEILNQNDCHSKL